MAKIKGSQGVKEAGLKESEGVEEVKREDEATTTTSKPSQGSLKSSSASGSREMAKDGGAGGGAPSGSADATTALITEATTLLKSLRSLKACKVKQVLHPAVGREEQVALLDGGATHPLRTAAPGERDHLQPIQVELAHGSTTLYRKENCSTLLSLDEVEPIIPLSLLVQHGFQIQWAKDGCTIKHPRQGPIPCWLRGGCPVMNRRQALDMLREFEELEQGRVDIEQEDVEWWIQNMPEFPRELLTYMKGQSWNPSGEELPWNRRQRRSHQTAKGVVVHLFSGANLTRWKKTLPSGYVWLFLDTQLGSRFDLHSPPIWGYLCSLAKQGQIRVVLGGPPCRTTSRLRNKGPPGPRRVRGRGHERWGISQLSEQETQLTNHDSALVLKQAGLWKMCQQSPKRRFTTGFLLESPQDPATYMDTPEGQESPSFFEWPQLQQLLEEDENMRMVCFDQGATGHCRRKPTGLLTNLPMMEQLEHCKGGGATDPIGGELSQRMAASRSWSEWSPGFVRATQYSLKEMLKEDDDPVQVAKLDLDQWRRHVRMQHVPFRRDCRACIEAMGTQHPHRRSKTASAAFTLAIDIIGPFTSVKDLATGRMARYALLGTVPIPVPDQLPSAPEVETLEEEHLEGVEPVEGLDEEEEVGDQDPGPGDDEEVMGEAMEEGEEPVEQVDLEAIQELKRPHELQNITMIEILEDRSVTSLLAGLSRLHARFRCMGINLMRLHSDREKGLLSRRVATWCGHRHMTHTFTQGDDPQSNGRAEAEVQQVKRRLRLILHQSQVEPDLWPGAIRHAAEERCRQQLQHLGIAVQPMHRFGAMVAVRSKRWHKAGQIANPFVSMQLVGPSPLMTSGWVVRRNNKVQHVRAAI